MDGRSRLFRPLLTELDRRFRDREGFDYRPTIAIFVLVCAAFAMLPVIKAVRDPSNNKDYSVWLDIGRVVRAGGDLYPHDPGLQFPYMYPPFAAIFAYAPLSTLGAMGMAVALCVGSAAAWLACVLLSVKLATGVTLRQMPLLYIVPSALTIPYIWDVFFLGQPNLVLLALVLGCLVLVRERHPWAGGALLAVATAIKAFPVLAAAALVRRRLWGACASVIVALVLTCIVAPGAVRGFERNLDDLSRWSSGMLGDQPGGRIAQRESASSAANQSLLALTTRLTRPVVAGSIKGEPFRLNAVSLGVRASQAIFLTLALALCVVYLASTRRCRGIVPGSRCRGFEEAMLLCLIPLLSPIGWTYYFCWLMPAFAVALNWLMERPAKDPATRRGTVLALGSTIMLAAAAVQMFDEITQALGATALGAVGMFLTLAWMANHPTPAPPAAFAVPASSNAA